MSQEKLNEKSSQVMEVVGEKIEQGKEVLNKKKETISNAVKAGKKAYEEGKEDLKGPAVKEKA